MRIVEGLEGTVEMTTELVIRFDYGSVVPWVRRLDDDTLVAIAGPDGLALRTPVDLEPHDMLHAATFTVSAGERVPFVLTWFPSHHRPPANLSTPSAHSHEYRKQDWRKWFDALRVRGRVRRGRTRSLAVLKALTYAPTGGIVAAPTTSLPEQIGGVRNWDYRYCWLRDATFTLFAMMNAGYIDEARAWRDWLLRAVAGDPANAQILYGVAGERRVMESASSTGCPATRLAPGPRRQRRPRAVPARRVRRGDGRVHQGAHRRPPRRRPCLVAAAGVMDFLEGAWDQPDEGIWEVRGPRRHFTHSKVLAWVAFDRAVHAVERFGLPGPVDRWRRLRDEVHREVCREAFDVELNSFTQSYGSDELDASTSADHSSASCPATIRGCSARSTRSSAT